MDKFIKIKKQNNKKPFSRDELYDKILDFINKNKNLCVYGSSGVGKTFLVKEILKNYNTIELNHEILRSKNDTHNFLAISSQSSAVVLVDEIDGDYQGWKEIVEHIKKGYRITKSSFIIITKPTHIVDFCEHLYIPPLSTEDIIKIGKKNFPNKNLNLIKENANKCKGNLRIFIYSFDFEGERDILLTPKETVHNLLCPSDISPSSYIGRTIDDHGYSWGIVHENYPRANTLTLDEMMKVAEHMSIADIYDNKLYTGDWELNKFFCHEAIICPCIILKQRLIRETLNPGSSWTKYNNMKMRQGKIRLIQNKQIRTKMTHETLMVIHKYCTHLELDELIPILTYYKINASDMDIINHLSFSNKIKPKNLNIIKKELKKYETVD